MNIDWTNIDAVRGWVSTGFLGFIAIMAGRFAKPLAEYLIKQRELRIQERQQDREGYGPLIATMQEQIKRMDAALTACEETHTHDSRRIGELEAQVAGLNRIIMAKTLDSYSELPATTKTMDEVARKSAVALLTSLPPVEPRS